ncbi:MAG: redox-regulated ATPase YchF [Nitrospiraceae bacterium]|nr:redox-regulated ATPase YchF [Nitrospiraceae bacterium]
MKIAITGFSNAGKTTIFNALTGARLETTAYPSVGGEPRLGVVAVPDERVERLQAIWKPRKTTHATVDYVDYMGLTKGDPKQNAKVHALIKDADALLQVVRAFEDPAVIHPLGKVDPLHDLRELEAELVLGDFMLVEKRLEGIEESIRKGRKEKVSEAERSVLLKCREALESERPLRALIAGPGELKAVRHLEFLSLKPEVVLFNVAEGEAGGPNADSLVRDARGLLDEKGSAATPVLAISGKIEMEIAQLPPEEQKAFLEDLGIEEPALRKLIRVSYELLDLVSFFTAGEDEVKAWTIKKDTPAPAAAGKIHSDIEKGFIRAEVISYDDFIGKAGASMAEARRLGLLRLEGKDYLVKDGDIINFRFNV